MSATQAFDLAADLLSVIEAAFVADGTALPARRYISNSGSVGVVFDCEEVVVGLERLFDGLPAQAQNEIVRCWYTIAAEYSVHILRCVPVPKDGNPPIPPSGAEIEASAGQIYRDGMVLLEGILTAYKAKKFQDNCHTIRIGDLTIVNPQGGIGGVLVRIECELQ